MYHARPVLRRNIRALQKALADWTPYDPEELSGLYDIHNAGSRHGVKLNTDRGSEMNADREFPGIAGRESSAGLHFGHESAGTGRPAPAEVTNHGTGTYNDEFTFPTADDDFSLPPLPDSVFLPGQLNVRKWIDDTRAGNYRTNPYYPERLRFAAANGCRVRSKSEVFWCDALAEIPVLYRYECALILRGGKTIYPDFTVLRPAEPRLIYIEHFGRMDDPDYAMRQLRRLQEYAESGYVLGRDVFFTAETAESPLSRRQIRTVLQTAVLSGSI